jgi:hypothetical protein
MILILTFIYKIDRKRFSKITPKNVINVKIITNYIIQTRHNPSLKSEFESVIIRCIQYSPPKLLRAHKILGV